MPPPGRGRGAAGWSSLEQATARLPSRPVDSKNQKTRWMPVLIPDEQRRVPIRRPHLIEPLVPQGAKQSAFITISGLPSSEGLRQLPVDNRLPVAATALLIAAVSVPELVRDPLQCFATRKHERRLAHDCSATLIPIAICLFPLEIQNLTGTKHAKRFTCLALPLRDLAHRGSHERINERTAVRPTATRPEFPPQREAIEIGPPALRAGITAMGTNFQDDELVFAELPNPRQLAELHGEKTHPTLFRPRFGDPGDADGLAVLPADGGVCLDRHEQAQPFRSRTGHPDDSGTEARY